MRDVALGLTLGTEGGMSWMGSFVKVSDRRKKVWSISTVNACSVGSLHGWGLARWGLARWGPSTARKGSGLLQRRATETSPCRGGGNAFFFARSGTHIILPTVTVAAVCRIPGAHLNKYSGRVSFFCALGY